MEATYRPPWLRSMLQRKRGSGLSEAYKTQIAPTRMKDVTDAQEELSAGLRQVEQDLLLGRLMQSDSRETSRALLSRLVRVLAERLRALVQVEDAPDQELRCQQLIDQADTLVGSFPGPSLFLPSAGLIPEDHRQPGPSSLDSPHQTLGPEDDQRRASDTNDDSRSFEPWKAPTADPLVGSLLGPSLPLPLVAMTQEDYQQPKPSSRGSPHHPLGPGDGQQRATDVNDDSHLSKPRKAPTLPRSHTTKGSHSSTSSRGLVKMAEVAAMEVKESYALQLAALEDKQNARKRQLLLRQGEELRRQQEEELRRQHEELRRQHAELLRQQEEDEWVHTLERQKEEVRRKAEKEAALAMARVLECQDDRQDRETLLSLPTLNPVQDLFLSRQQPGKNEPQEEKDPHLMQQEEDKRHTKQEEENRRWMKQEEEDRCRLLQDRRLNRQEHLRRLQHEEDQMRHQEEECLRRQENLEQRRKELCRRRELEHQHTCDSRLDPSLGHELAKAVADTMAASRVPVPKPKVFNGNPLDYPSWIAAFSHLVENAAIKPEDKMLILRDFLEGPARDAVEDLFFDLSGESYQNALGILRERFGQDYAVSEAVRRRLASWPVIREGDSSALRSFVDYLRQCKAMLPRIQGLRTLEDPSQLRSLICKLPESQRRSWHIEAVRHKQQHGAYPELSALVKHLHMKCEALSEEELCQKSSHGVSKSTTSSANPSHRVYQTSSELTRDGQSSQHSLNENSRRKCSFCDETHNLQLCEKFGRESYATRKEFAKKTNLCFRCMEAGHSAKGCFNKSKCKDCGGRHVSVMHDPNFTPRQRHPKGNESTYGRRLQHEDSANVYRVGRPHESRLYTLFVPVWVSSTRNPEHSIPVYAMLDAMSDASFIDADILSQLDVATRETTLDLKTLSSRRTVSCVVSNEVMVKAWESGDTISVPRIYSSHELGSSRNQVPTREVIKSIPHLKHLSQHFHELMDIPVGLLLGADTSAALRPLDHVTGRDDEPYAVRTKLGWSLVGTVATLSEGPAVSGAASEKTEVTCLRVKDLATERLLASVEREFTDCDDAGTLRLSQEDMRFMSIMEGDTTVTEDGHYEMPLPFIKDDPVLPSNRSQAHQRLEGLKRRFSRDSNHLALYTQFMQKLIRDGHAEKVPMDEICARTVWYIPHHGVYNPNKPGKIRVVFDCAASFKGSSLNDLLLTGPDLMNSLTGVLVRFRMKQIAVTCDIEQMFHQFSVTPRHRDYLRFLWWPDADLDREPEDFRMKVHLFGAASSPGCANYALKRIARDHEKLHPPAAAFIKHDFYVDDGLTSLSGPAEAIDLLHGTKTICDQGGLHVHKIASNSQQVLECFPQTDVVLLHTAPYLNDKASAIIEKALGVCWDLQKDTLQLAGDRIQMTTTRRGLLAVVASIFDPLGLMCPAVLRGRQILQEACRIGLGWDAQLPLPLMESWRQCVEDLKTLTEVQIPRCYFGATRIDTEVLELHHFSDASTTGYGTCSYLRILNASEEPKSALVMAKSRVTPMRAVTMPRLELQAAVLAVKAAKYLDQEFRGHGIKHWFWTDSKIVLGYIHNTSKRFHVFVANRLQQIRDFSIPEQWNHVSTEQNPADMASRGARVEELQDSMWMHGPGFLGQRDIPLNPQSFQVGRDDKEVRTFRTFTSSGHWEDKGGSGRGDSDWNVESFTRRFSSLRKLLRTLSIVKGVLRRKTFRGALGLLTPGEERISLLTLIRITQNARYSSVSGRDPKELKTMSPVEDDDGLLRVGGRLGLSSLHDQAKHPIIIPQGHLGTLLARREHCRIGHQGRTSTLGALQLGGFWLCGARRIVSSVIHRCVFCSRQRGLPMNQKMADVPRERTEPAPPFTHSGMDCFGPFIVRRGRTDVKRYGIIFTCLTSRAVHLEVLEDMSTDAFLNALRRFLATRGVVKSIRSDRGTNFVGAEAELRRAWKELDLKRIEDGVARKDCLLLFNPPSSSHYGGVWERLILITRRILTALMREHGRHLSSDGLSTFFCEAAAIVNSRPLCVDQLGDADACEPLTPNHLLTLRPEPLSAPPGVFERSDLYCRKRWRRVQYLADQFWSRWRKEYLLSLQTRRKWFNERDGVRVGMVVLLMDPLASRGEWKLGRICQVSPSHDGRVRSVRLKTAAPTKDRHGNWSSSITLLDRPVHKLVPLHVED